MTITDERLSSRPSPPQRRAHTGVSRPVPQQRSTAQLASFPPLSSMLVKENTRHVTFPPVRRLCVPVNLPLRIVAHIEAIFCYFAIRCSKPCCWFPMSQIYFNADTHGTSPDVCNFLHPRNLPTSYFQVRFHRRHIAIPPHTHPDWIFVAA